MMRLQNNLALPSMEKTKPEDISGVPEENNQLFPLKEPVSAVARGTTDPQAPQATKALWRLLINMNIT